MKRPTAEELEELRTNYPVGTRIRLILMTDLQAPEPGTLGTVTGIDDIGAIHMKWDNGSSLALIPDDDQFEIYKTEE